MSKKIILQRIFISFVFVVLTTAAAFAQTTAFNYQGRLTDAGMPPTANYDFEFRLFNEVGAVIAGQQRLNVPVVSGVFNVSLDFGAGAFPGAARTLEIAVRPAGGGGFTTLAPRQPINSAPYSIKSLNAANADNSAQIGGINAGAMVLTAVACP